MGGEWKDVSLGDVVQLQRGHDLPEKDRKPGSVPVLGSFGITGWHNESRAEGPGVTIGRSGGSIGVVSYIKEDYWPLNTCLYVTDFQGNDPKFCYYWLKTFNFKGFNSGSAQPSLNRNYIYGMSGRIPDKIGEQRSIANILGALDEKIELNRQMNQTLEQMAQTLFKSWFIDFDPVVYNAVQAGNPVPDEFAEAAARYRENPETRPVAQDLLEAFPDSFEESELGLIPKGWNVGLLTQVAILETKTVHPAESPDILWEHYSIPAYDEDHQPQWARGESIKSGKYRVPANSVLASKLNPQFPRIWLPDVQSPEVAICSTEFMPFVPVEEGWRPFLYELLKSAPVQERVRSHVSGSTGSRQRVKPKEVAEMPVLVPEADILDGFSQVVEGFHDRILGNREASRVLGELRDTLLPKLISGELRVGDPESSPAEIE